MTRLRGGECAACGDPFGEFECPRCRGRGKFLGRCKPCHYELAHGAVPMVTDGKKGGVPTPACHENDSGTDSPWHENAVRALEDGGP